MGFIKRFIHLKTEDKHTQDLWLMAKHQSSDLMFRRQSGRMVLPRNAATSYHFDRENVDKPGIWVYPKNEIGGGFFVYMFLLKLWKLLASLNLTH